MEWINRHRSLLATLVIIGIGMVVYADLFDASKQFTAYDDNAYVTSQPLVKSLTARSIARIFDPETAVAGNYHPLTVLSLAVDYQVFGPHARAFGLVNLALHLMTSLLVLVLLRRLLPDRAWMPEIGALWFAIHPIHVESVAWVSGRKDVLYGLWFVTSILLYLTSQERRSTPLLIGAFGAFVLACVSKPMAVTLPVLLVVLDVWKGRGITLRSVVEKIPFFALSVVIGIITLGTQSESGAIADATTFSVVERSIIAGYGYVMYWVHLVWPHTLNAFYPYPSVNNVFTLPWYAYPMPLLALGAIGLPWLMVWRQRTNRVTTSSIPWTSIALGTSWFSVTIVLVLQLVSVGMVIMADRYTYIPMIGMICVVLVLIDMLLQRQQLLGWGVIVAFTILQAATTFHQVGMWRNTETIWTSILERSGNTGSQDEIVRANLSDGYIMIYVLRGIHYFEVNKPDLAYNDLRHLLTTASPRTDAYERLGLLAGLRGKIDESIAAYSIAIRRPDATADAFLNRGIGYQRYGRDAEALQDFELGLMRNPSSTTQQRLLRGIEICRRRLGL